MKTCVKRFIACIALSALVLTLCAGSAFALSANVVMKVSRTAQDAVIDAGEDLAIDVDLEGVEPASYRWYFGEAPVAGADQRVLTIVSAKVEDAGTYRMEAFDADGKMLVSMEFAVRVIDKSLPKAGDGTLDFAPVAGIGGALTLGMAAALIVRKKRFCA